MLRLLAKMLVIHPHIISLQIYITIVWAVACLSYGMGIHSSYSYIHGIATCGCIRVHGLWRTEPSLCLSAHFHAASVFHPQPDAPQECFHPITLSGNKNIPSLKHIAPRGLGDGSRDSHIYCLCSIWRTTWGRGRIT